MAKPLRFARRSVSVSLCLRHTRTLGLPWRPPKPERGWARRSIASSSPSRKRASGPWSAGASGTPNLSRTSVHATGSAKFFRKEGVRCLCPSPPVSATEILPARASEQASERLDSCAPGGRPALCALRPALRSLARSLRGQEEGRRRLGVSEAGCGHPSGAHQPTHPPTHDRLLCSLPATRVGRGAALRSPLWNLTTDRPTVPGRESRKRKGPVPMMRLFTHTRFHPYSCLCLHAVRIRFWGAWVTFRGRNAGRSIPEPAGSDRAGATRTPTTLGFASLFFLHDYMLVVGFVCLLFFSAYIWEERG